MVTYYRIHDTERCAPADLLLAEHQTSSVWVGAAERRCPGCGGAGVLLTEVDPDDDDDTGVETCDDCDGEGRITIETQDGVSVCRSLRGLIGYLSQRSFYVAPSVLLVALEGEEVDDDQDVDADAGAVLVRPTRIVRVEPLPQEILELADDGELD